MADVRKLMRYSSHHLIGRTAGMALGFVSFPIFTRIFSVSDYGVISLVLQTVLVFTVLSKAGLQNSVQRFELELTAASPAQKQNFFSTIFLGNAAIAFFCTAAFVILVSLAPATVLSAGSKKILVLGSVLIVARAVRSMYTNMLQVEGKTIAFNVLEVSIKAATIAAICTFAFGWQRTSTAFFMGLVVVEAGAVVVLLPEFARRTGGQLRGLDGPLLRRFIGFGMPLMWAELAWVILSTGDRYVVQLFRGTEAVGYYSAAYNISSYAQEIILTPLNLAFFPVCVDLWTHYGQERTKAFLSKTILYFIVGGVFIVAMTIVLSGDLIVLLASRKYLQAHVLLPWLVAAMTISALQVFFKTGLMLQHQPAKVAHATTAAAVVNIGLNFLLIPRIGILGAAFATLAANAFWIFLMARSAFKVLRFSINYFAIVRYLGSGLAVVFVAGHIYLKTAVAELFVRGAVGLACYAGLVLLLDKSLREMILGWVRASAVGELCLTKLTTLEQRHSGKTLQIVPVSEQVEAASRGAASNVKSHS